MRPISDLPESYCVDNMKKGNALADPVVSMLWPTICSGV